MNIFVNVRDPEMNPRFREWAERRLQLAFTRYDGEILRIDLTASDDNGPRGGVDKRCAVAVATRGLGTLTFVNVAVSPRMAVASAIRRARRTLHRRLALRRNKRIVASRLQTETRESGAAR